MTSVRATSRGFYPFCLLLLTALVTGCLISPAEAQQGAPVAATVRPQQKPASEVLKKQDPPRINQRLLETASLDNTTIIVSLGKQRAYFMVNGEVTIDTPISSGKRAGMTPKGSYKILEKDKDHRSNVYGNFVNPHTGKVMRAGVSTKIDSAPSGSVYSGAPMHWFMRLTDQGVGMHTGILPGYPASHGCVRLPEDIAHLIYDHVVVGVPVTIQD